MRLLKYPLVGFFFLIVITAGGQAFTSSNLPIIVINTGSSTIVDEPKVMVDMGIIDNGSGINNITDPFNGYDGKCGIEFRGNSTQGFDKKTYSIELWTAAGVDTVASLLGMPTEEDWILHAMIIDKTLLRIPLSFYLSERMGHYSPRYRFCEVVIDGDYRGVYILTEKIKRDANRVPIADLLATDLTGDEVTGGYILRIDWLDNPSGFESNYNAQAGDPMFFQWYYPKAGNIAPQQAAYIEQYMDEFEEALFSPNYMNSQGKIYWDYMDITSFADFLISNELAKNSDGYKLSSYLFKHKDSQGGKFHMGPIWDFDQSYGYSHVCSCVDPTGWTYLQNQNGCEDLETMPMWWQELMGDPLFQNHLACRWDSMRQGPLHIDSLNAWIDSNRAVIQQGVDRNFVRWPILGVYIWDEPTPIPQDYQEEIDYLKNWLPQRLAWLDANMPGDCSQDVVGLEQAPVKKEFTVFPNPAGQRVTIDYGESVRGDVALLDLSGRTLQRVSVSGSHRTQLYTGDLSDGVYLLQGVLNDHPYTGKFVVRH